MTSFSSHAHRVEEGSSDNSPAQTKREGLKWLAILAGVAILISLNVSSAFATVGGGCTFTVKGTTMKLNGDCTTDQTIYIPQGMTLDGGGHTITAVDPVGGHWLGSVIRNSGNRANVINLTISASGLQDVCDDIVEPSDPTLTGQNRLRGISFYGASGLITHNRIVGINQGHGSVCNEGTGILVQNLPLDGTHPNTAQVAVLDNEIVDAQAFGIASQGDVATTIGGNRIGLSPDVGAMRQTGMIIAYGSKAIVSLNNVQGAFTDGKVFTVYGIYIFETSNVTVATNSISGIQEGIYVESQGYRVAGANDNRIQANLITGAFEGIVLVSRSTAASAFNAHVDRNLISLNVIKSSAATTPLTGVFYGVQQFVPTYTPIADSNQIKNNVISGYINPLFDLNTTNTVVSGNVIN